MEDLQENGIPQNPEEMDTISSAEKVLEDKNKSEEQISDFNDEQTATEDQTAAGSHTKEITPKSLGVPSAKVRRNFSVRMKVTNDCIVVTVMRADSDDTLTFVNNIRW